jgi:hypothetical protein
MIPSSPNGRLAAVARKDALLSGSDLSGSSECARRRPERRKVCCKQALEPDQPPISAIAQGARERIGASRQMPPVCPSLFSAAKPSSAGAPAPRPVGRHRPHGHCGAHPPSVRCPNAQCEPGTPSLLMAPVISIGLLPVRLLAMARSYLGRSARRRCGRTHELRSRLGQEIIICDLRSARPSLCHRNRQRGQVGASKRPSEGGSA